MNTSKWGQIVRIATMQLILDFMQTKEEAKPQGVGLSQTNIFKECCLDWGDVENANSTQQQYWVVGALRTLEKEGKVVRIRKSGPWRLV